MVIAAINPEPIESFARMQAKHVRPHNLVNASYPGFIQKKAKLTLDPYLLVAGKPVIDEGWGIAATSTAYLDASALTVGNTVPTPSSVSTGATQRFLPLSGDTAVGGGGIRRWWPNGGTVASYPQLLVRAKNTVNSDPLLASNYSYEANHKRKNQPAWTINGAGYFEIQTGSGTTVNYNQASWVMVFVPHNGAGAYYPLYDSGPITTTGRRFAIWYRKGRIQIVASGTPLLQHQCYLDHSEPIIVGFSVDKTTNIGRFVAADRRRVSRSFNVNSIAGMDMNAWIGAEPTTAGGSTPNWNRAGDFDILDLNMWLDKALDFRELESVVTLLAQVYSVGP